MYFVRNKVWWGKWGQQRSIRWEGNSTYRIVWPCTLVVRAKRGSQSNEQCMKVRESLLEFILVAVSKNSLCHLTSGLETQFTGIFCVQN